MKQLMLALLVVCSLNGMLTAQTKSYTIQILVQEDANDAPLAGAEIWLQDRLLGTTDARGEYLFTEAKPGERYTFTARMTGYELKSESRFAKEDMNRSLGALSLRKISTLIDTYQELLKQDSPDTKRMDNLYRTILTSLDAERNRKLKSEFLAQNSVIEQSKKNAYREDMTARDQEIKPILKDNLDKLTQFKR